MLKIASLFVLLASALYSAEPGSIVVNQTILRYDAIAGDANCSFLGPIEQNIVVVCYVEDVEEELHDYRPKSGGAALTGSFKEDGNEISWSILRDGDVYKWEIHANGTVQSGTFSH